MTILDIGRVVLTSLNRIGSVYPIDGKRLLEEYRRTLQELVDIGYLKNIPKDLDLTARTPLVDYEALKSNANLTESVVSTACRLHLRPATFQDVVKLHQEQFGESYKTPDAIIAGRGAYKKYLEDRDAIRKTGSHDFSSALKVLLDQLVILGFNDFDDFSGLERFM